MAAMCASRVVAVPADVDPCRLKRFPAKWITGSREENASKQEIESRSDSIGTEKALADAADGPHDPSPQRANPAVARLLGAGYQINRLAVASLHIKRRHQLFAESWSRLDQRSHGERDAKPLLRGL